uniref:Putative secreted protein n=1 Tax=Anopheles darlingi TaxID=43151 RepID=A0A2M4DRA5_ANODA
MAGRAAFDAAAAAAAALAVAARLDFGGRPRRRTTGCDDGAGFRGVFCVCLGGGTGVTPVVRALMATVSQFDFFVPCFATPFPCSALENAEQRESRLLLLLSLLVPAPLAPPPPAAPPTDKANEELDF